MFRHLGSVEEEANGNFKVTRNGETLMLHPRRTKDVGTTDEVISLKHFLKRSEVKPAEPIAHNAHCLLVIDHQQARIFHSELHGAVP